MQTWCGPPPRIMLYFFLFSDHAVMWWGIPSPSLVPPIRNRRSAESPVLWGFFMCGERLSGPARKVSEPVGGDLRLRHTGKKS